MRFERGLVKNRSGSRVPRDIKSPTTEPPPDPTTQALTDRIISLFP